MHNIAPTLALHHIAERQPDTDPRYAVASERLTEPTALPIRMADARAQLRIDDERLDGMIELWLQGLTAHLEQITQRALITQRWKFTYAGFCDEMILPITPVARLESIRYRDSQGQWQTLDSSSIALVHNAARSSLTRSSQIALPSTEITEVTQRAVEIVCTCGYGDDPTNVPASLRLYLMMRLVEQFDSASSGSAPAQSSFADYLLEPYRVFQAG